MRNETEYISSADTAKLIRQALKKAFSGVKFYVNTRSSIAIAWVDGPTKREVEAVAGVYSGADFDGTIDLRVDNDSWLLPDGTVEPAYSWGTEGSRGMIAGYDYPKPCEGARLVHFGSDFVFANRHFSAAFLQEVGVAVNKRTSWDIPLIKPTPIWLSKSAQDAKGAYYDWIDAGYNDPQRYYERIANATSAYPTLSAENIQAGIVEVLGQPFAFVEPEPVVVASEPQAASKPTMDKFKVELNHKHANANAKFGGTKW